MDPEPDARRRQYSSCDGCRVARTACDASQNGYQPGNLAWEGSCSRCSAKSRKCTFQWMIARKRGDRPFRRNHWSQKPVVTEDSFVQWQDAGPHGTSDTLQGKSRGGHKTNGEAGSDQQSWPCLRPASAPKGAEQRASDYSGNKTCLNHVTAEATQSLERWLECIFDQGFGAIFGQWVGNDGCPLVNASSDQNALLPIVVFRSLDVLLNREPSVSALKGDAAAEQSLQRAIYAYTARWLPLIPGASSFGHDQLEDIVRQYWRIARRDMLKVINRVCYRSVLSLLLFGLTAVPTGISEEEELDGITGDVCAQTALKQIQQLRGRLRGSQFDGSRMPVRTTVTEGRSPDSCPTPEWIDFENRAYWATVIWDTSAAVTSNLKSVITTGLRGACSEPAWILSRAFLSGSFQRKSTDWLQHGFQVGDDTAAEIIRATSVCRLYTWRTIASFKEGLGEGAHEDSLQMAWEAVLDVIRLFKKTIRPLLDVCEGNLHFLSQTNRFSWYETLLHYYLGIRILIDTVEAVDRSDLLSQLSDIMEDVEQRVLNILVFGLNNSYRIQLHDTSSHGDDPKATVSTIGMSLIGVDPYPHYVVLAVQLLEKSIARKYHQGGMEQDTYAHLLSTLLRVMDAVPRMSSFACNVRLGLQYTFERI